VKDAKGDLLATTEVLARSDLAYYCGEDALNLPMLALGAVGMVSVVAHAAGDLYAAMVRAVDAGDLAEARRLNARVLPAVLGIMTRTQGAIMAKATMQLLGILQHRTMRPPLVEATEDQMQRLSDDLAAAGLLP
jgi:4-hydroxy-tetrahydrodipicolinate synthase